MTDSRGERAKKFAAMHLDARISAGKSQDYMAEKLQVSANTVKNWEKGVSSPDFFESLRWFEVLNINPLPAYLSYVSPYKTSNLKETDNSFKNNESFRALNEELPTATKQALIYIFRGEHGASSNAVVHLLLAYLHLPIKTRVIPGMSIALRYDLEKEIGTLLHKNAILPNMEELNFSLERAYNSTMHGDYGYTIVTRERDGISSDEEAERTKFAEMHFKARNLAGISQEDMAMELGVTKNTIKNWEKGVSMPSFFQSLEWFRTLNINPYPWYLPFISLFSTQDNMSVGKEESINKQFKALCDKLSVEEKKAILFLFYGKHGCSPFAVVQLFLAYYHIPIRDRLVSRITIAHMYKLESELGNIICKADTLPDMKLLEESINESRIKIKQESEKRVM